MRREERDGVAKGSGRDGGRARDCKRRAEKRRDGETEESAQRRRDGRGALL